MKQYEIKKLFYYKDGNLFYRENRGKKKRNEKVGYLSDHGYVRVHIEKKFYAVHRLIWIFHNGNIPENLEIDHINREKTDNRIENLRVVTKTKNIQNRNMKGYTKFRGKFRSHIKHEGKLKILGSFDTEKEARNAYLEAKKEQHSVFL